MKKCKRCNIEYDLQMYGKNRTAKDGYRNICKDCTKEALNIKPRDTFAICSGCSEEKQRINFANRTNICKLCRNIREKEKRDENREEYNAKSRDWRAGNKDLINAKKREREQARRDVDPIYRLRHNLSTRLYMAVSKKVGKTFELVGCSRDELVSHLESKFTKGMMWDNYGTWHVDHIKPCCSFNLEDPEEQKKCFHWKNLQPLWARDNTSKGGKF